MTKYGGKDLLIQRATTLTAWVTLTAYKVGDYVSQSGTNYVCLIAHTAGTFATDLAALKWAVQASQPYQTVAGMRSTSMSINNEQVDVTEKGSVPWRQLLAVGIRSMELSASDIFSDAYSMDEMQNDSMNGTIATFKIISGRGDSFLGSFLVGTMERNGEYNGAEQYSLSLASSGTIAYTAAP